MAVFRIEKQKNYTVMCNYHLQDMTLSLKAKGLLSQMLSLPENWDYTLRGLAAINKESVNTIGSIVNELIEAGYIIREQSRGNSGKFSSTEYVIFELPQKKETEERKKADGIQDCNIPFGKNGESIENTDVSPCHKKRDTVKRDTDFCDANKILNKQNKKEYNTHSNQSGNLYHIMQKGTGKQQEDEYEAYREIIRENISYDALIADHPNDLEQIDGIVNIILDVVTSKRGTIWIAKEEKPQSVVKSKFLKLDKSHIDYVLYCLKHNTSRIQDIMAYLRTSLYNAPDTTDFFWKNRVMNDIYGVRDGPDEAP